MKPARPLLTRAVAPAVVAEWTDADDRAFRAETRRLYASRTPPTEIQSALPENRVQRSESRTWAVRTLGKYPPETDAEWLAAYARWYRTMAITEARMKGARVRTQGDRIIETWEDPA